MAAIGRVLVVAGSDSGGAAGVQADIKSILMQGAYATTALTALTAQNTLGVQDIFDVPADFVARQIESVLVDIGADIVKTGMMARRAVIESVAETITDIPMVIDPVMAASSGDILLPNEAIAALDALLVRRAFVATPNLPEASLLVGRDVETLNDMKHAADDLMHKGAHAVLIKGGHQQQGEQKESKAHMVQDLLAMQSGQHVFEHPRIATRNTHGTGCTLASAVAGQLAKSVAGQAMRPDDTVLYEAVRVALDYVHRAIATAPDIGQGHGPINHVV